MAAPLASLSSPSSFSTMEISGVRSFRLDEVAEGEDTLSEPSNAAWFCCGAANSLTANSGFTTSTSCLRLCKRRITTNNGQSHTNCATVFSVEDPAVAVTIILSDTLISHANSIWRVHCCNHLVVATRNLDTVASTLHAH